MTIVPHPTRPTPPTASNPRPRLPRQLPLHPVSPALHLQQTIIANTRSIMVGVRIHMQRMEAIRATWRIITTMPSRPSSKEVSREEHHLDHPLRSHLHHPRRVEVHLMEVSMPWVDLVLVKWLRPVLTGVWIVGAAASGAVESSFLDGYLWNRARPHFSPSTVLSWCNFRPLPEQASSPLIS